MINSANVFMLNNIQSKKYILYILTLNIKILSYDTQFKKIISVFCNKVIHNKQDIYRFIVELQHRGRLSLKRQCGVYSIWRWRHL